MAVTIRRSRPVIEAELIELSALNPGYQFERTRNGGLVVTPTGSEGGRRSAEVLRQLAEWNHRTGLGVVFDSSAGFTLPDSAVLSPDACWITWERWRNLTIEEREGFAPLCPDAVFEDRSKSDDVAELRKKMNSYRDNGAELGVLIDSYERLVEVYRPRQAPQRFDDPKELSLDPELPGFVLDLTRIF
jgi:Uma2 family endonuclease